MTILFICRGGRSCKSIMAKEILLAMDQQLAITATGLEPLIEVPPIAKQAMAELKLNLHQDNFTRLDQASQKSYTYLITLSENTREAYRQLSLHYDHKLHLNFSNPEQPKHPFASPIEAYRHLRDDIQSELFYFYHHVLTKKAAQ
ncbi:hypothetical protein ACRTDU_07785 [Sunxiuqinia elliptica]|uniref:Protein-tyrosine-phosphatase n=1 Tax=Sunxiuqinia elliptica TaxID=655355 RepID=A0A1I2I9N8_9BACT|nr:hypothetical protein [Sunxiuqinia elliptica]SFF39022.1 Protein-tyrosine-phosphatase [Sunxiuqinia elliptica]